MLPSLIISALVVRSLGGYEMKLQMMQYTALATPGKRLLHFSIKRAEQVANLSFLYPAPFHLYTMCRSRVIIRSYETSWSSRSPLQSHSMFVFLSRLLAFQTRKGTIIWTLCAHAKAALWGPFLELICFKEKLTSLNRTHLMNLRKLGKCSFKTW